jgi:gamma-glutamyltranspeptidase / glutathione hydrolase
VKAPASKGSPPRRDRRCAVPRRQRSGLLRLVLATLVSAALSCCSLINGSPPLPPAGQVVGDEPQAVQAGATVLAHGGDAADAAAATYFALTVNYPIAAGLGGGGICIAYNSAQQKAEEFDFLPRRTAGGGPYAIPGAPAGFAALQAAYGRLPWQRVVSPAEGFAAAGFPISQALYARLAPNQDLIRLDAQLAAEFLDETGHLKPAGTMVEAPVLGQTLSQLRVHGAYALYRGAIAEALADYARAQGGSMTTDELASYRPVRTAPLRISINGGVALLPTEKVGAGQFARALFAKLVDAQGQIIDSDHTGAGVASATKTTLDSYKIASLPRDFGATGFAAVDASGAAVSCAVGMNGPFGSGRTAGNTGVVLAAAPKSGETELASAFLMPAIETSDGALSLAGSGIGGPNGTAMIALALLDLARGNDLTQPGALHATGFEPFETVNVIQCRDGICATVADPRTFGLGAAAQ